MSAITISDEARRKLAELSGRSGLADSEELEKAVDAYYKFHFWGAVNSAYARLQSNPAEWADYRHELGGLEGTLGDGLTAEDRP